MEEFLHTVKPQVWIFLILFLISLVFSFWSRKIYKKMKKEFSRLHTSFASFVSDEDSKNFNLLCKKYKIARLIAIGLIIFGALIFFVIGAL